MPFKVGMGAQWLTGLYGAANLNFNAYQRGLLGSSLSISQTQDNLKLIDGNGIYMGNKATDTTQIHHQDLSAIAPAILLGFDLGLFKLGVRSFTQINTNTITSTYNNGLTAAQSSSVVKTTDATGAVSSEIGTVYAPTGFSKNNSISEQLEAGLVMPLGFLTAKAKLGIEIGSVESVGFGSVETYTTESGVGYASYSAPSGVLGSLGNLVKWNYDDQTAGNNSIQLSIPLYAEAEIPMNLFGASSKTNFGLEYRPSFTLYNNTLKGLNGGDTTLTGTGTTKASMAYVSVLDALTGFFKVTKTTQYEISHSTFKSNMSQEFRLPLAVEVAPSSTVRFAFRLTPRLLTSGYEYDKVESTKTTVIVDDGDGLAAASDGDDTTTVTVAQKLDQNYNYSKTSLYFKFEAGVQLEVIPSFLRFNMGTTVSMNPISQEVTTSKYSGLESTIVHTTIAGITNTSASSVTNNPANDDITRTIKDTAVSTTVGSRMGLTLFLNPNVTLDFLMNSPNALNLFSTQSTGSGSGFFDLNNYTIQMTILLPPQAPSEVRSEE